jgi:hypothetical protein
LHELRDMHRIAILAVLSACTSPPLAERLDEPDRGIAACAGGAGEHESTVSGVAVDLDDKPVVGVRIDVATAWGSERSFPTSGCSMATAFTNERGEWGPVKVRTATSQPIFVALATGDGLAPTLADKRGGCLLGCATVSMTVLAVPAATASAWREELYADGMEYALNRGLVAYQYRGSDGRGAAGVRPAWRGGGVDAERHGLALDRDVRFLASSSMLAPPGTETTTSTGYALVGRAGDERGYFEMSGTRGGSVWQDVGVIVATGWIYFETSDVSP